MALWIRLACTSFLAYSFSFPCMAMRWLRQTTTFLLYSSSSSEVSSRKGLYLSMALLRKAVSRQQIRRKASYRSWEKQSFMLPSNSMSRSPSLLDLSMVGTYLHRNQQSRLMRSLCMSIGSALARLRRVLREQSESSVESHYFSCELQSPICLSNLSRQFSRMSRSFLAILEWLLPEVPLSSKRNISSKQRVSLSLNSCTPISPTSSSIRLQLNSSKAGMQPTQWQRVSRQRRIRWQRSVPSSCKQRQRYLRILRMSLSSVSLKWCASADETIPSGAPNPSLSSILSMVRLCSTFMGDVLSPSTSKLATNTPSNSLHSNRSMATRALLQLCSSPCGSSSSRALYILVMTNSLREACRGGSNVRHSTWILRVRVFCAQMRVWVWRAYAWMAEKDSKKREMWWLVRRAKMSLRVLAISEVGAAVKERSRMSTSLGHSTLPSLMRSNRHQTSSRKGRSIGALLFIIWLNANSEAIPLCIYTCAPFMPNNKISPERKRRMSKEFLKEVLSKN